MLAAVATILSVGHAPDPLSSTQLSQAIDASIMQLHGTAGWFEQIRASNGYPNAQNVASCTPSDERWVFPAKESATGLLRRVLDSNKLKVAGVQWSQPGAADYITDPANPSGFWPEYLTAIVDELSLAYGQTITIERVYYSTSAIVVQKVEDGEVDCSEPYYYLGGFHSTSPRIESHEFSCVTAGLASSFYTKKDSGIQTLENLYETIESGPNRVVGFIGKGNYDAVSAMLPSTTTPVYNTNATEIGLNVQLGVYVAGYVSEGQPANPERYELFPTGTISPRVILFRKDQLTDGGGSVVVSGGEPPPPPCTLILTRRRLMYQATLLHARGAHVPTAAEPKAQPPASTHVHPRPPTSSPAGNVNDAYAVALIVVAAVTLVLAVLLAWVIVKERRGSPLFMPLISTMQTSTVDMAAKPSTANSAV